MRDPLVAPQEVGGVVEVAEVADAFTLGSAGHLLHAVEELRIPRFRNWVGRVAAAVTCATGQDLGSTRRALGWRPGLRRPVDQHLCAQRAVRQGPVPVLIRVHPHLDLQPPPVEVGQHVLVRLVLPGVHEEDGAGVPPGLRGPAGREVLVEALDGEEADGHGLGVHAAPLGAAGGGDGRVRLPQVRPEEGTPLDAAALQVLLVQADVALQDWAAA
mmetsp:Transcript_113033/g.364996  ORF Transcript_113033/g.364996 Transcript_113033/m.364996 type:complete len:215 (-) Transcript_113033:414-1058(-)